MPSLSMPLFVNPDDVILRMQLSAELTGINEVVSSGIIGAQLHVQRVLDGKFSRQSQNCMFHLLNDSFSGIQPGGVFRLEIPSGFIRRDTAVVVSYSTNDTPFGDFEVISTSEYKVDYDRGYILLSAEYGNSYVSVQCATGFEDGTTPWPIVDVGAYDSAVEYAVDQKVVYNGAVWECIATKYVESPIADAFPPSDLLHWSLSYVPMEAIPVELYEAILSMVPVIFDAAQTTNRNAEAESQYKKAADHAGLLMQPFMRTMGFSFRPVWK